MRHNSPLTARWLGVGLALAGLCLAAGCSSSPPPKPPPDSLHRHAVQLDIGVPRQGILMQPSTFGRHRYYVAIPKEGLINVQVSWNDPDGLDRVIVIGGGTMADTVLARDQLRVDHVKRADRGAYYIELVPGRYNTSYDILVDFEAL